MRIASTLVIVVFMSSFALMSFAWQSMPPVSTWGISTTFTNPIVANSNFAAWGTADSPSHQYQLEMIRYSDYNQIYSAVADSTSNDPSTWTQNLSAPSGGWSVGGALMRLYADNIQRDAKQITFVAP